SRAARSRSTAAAASWTASPATRAAGARPRPPNRIPAHTPEGTTMRDDLPIAVLGAGPVGLAAAAHLVERGLTPLVLEASTEIAASVRAWGHVRLFSPWRYDVDKAAARLLERERWIAPPPDELPTGDELLQRYLRPLAESAAI